MTEKVFVSDFNRRLDMYGLSGYGVDVNSVMNALESYQSRKRDNSTYADRIEASLPEYKTVHKIFNQDFIKWESWKEGAVAGPRKMFSDLPTTLTLFDIHITQRKSLPQAERNSSEFYNGWVTAHVNHVLNAIYDLGLPELDRYLLINAGNIEECVRALYGGRNIKLDSKQYQAVLLGEKRKLNRDLTNDEIESVKRRFFITDESQIEAIINTVMIEMQNEWKQFINKDIEDILSGR